MSYDVSIEEEDDDGSQSESDEETELPDDNISEKEEEKKVVEVHKHSNGKKKHRTTTEATILASEEPSFVLETTSENSFTKNLEFDHIFSKENEYKNQEADLPKNRHENKYLGFNYSSQETNESYRPHIPEVDSMEPLNASSFGKLPNAIPHHERSELNTSFPITNTSRVNILINVCLVFFSFNTDFNGVSVYRIIT